MLMKLGRPSPATVIACLALFFALAGGSAIALNGKNTVDSGDIKKNAVKTSDIADNAVTTKKIKNDNVRAADIQSNAVGTGEIGNGQVGAVDIAPAEPLRDITGLLRTGGENDCLWTTTPPPGVDFPFRSGPPGYYKDALGFVHLSGLLFPVAGSGGDAECGGGDAGENVEDSIAFIMPEGYRPTNDVIGGSGGGVGVLIGSTPLFTAFATFPAGAVTNLGTGLALSLSGLVFEPAGLPGGVPRRDPTSTARRSAGGDWQKSLAELFG